MGYVADRSIQQKKDEMDCMATVETCILPPRFAVTSSHANLADFMDKTATTDPACTKADLNYSISLMKVRYHHKDAGLLTGISLATKTRVTILRLSKSRSADSDSILG